MRLLSLLLLLASLALLAGCASTESDNVSTRPWNSPMGWENGLPSGINEGR
ncbi:MAG TPA: hypothetical protein VFV96_09690 [Verrucomicrobiae bacterium]|jgi:hypothetical protein|nr:hypothetical protein [Verrucomicrobiae bacterium]